MSTEVSAPSRRRGAVAGWIGLVLTLTACSPWIVLWSGQSIDGSSLWFGHSWDALDTDMLGGAALPLQWGALSIAFVAALTWLLARSPARGGAMTSLVTSVIAFGATAACLVAAVVDVSRFNDLAGGGMFGVGPSMHSAPGPGLVLPVLGSILLIVGAGLHLSGGVTAGQADRHRVVAQAPVAQAAPDGGTVLRPEGSAAQPGVQYPGVVGAPDADPGAGGPPAWTPTPSQHVNGPWPGPGTYPPGHVQTQFPTVQFQSSRTSLNPWIPVGVLTGLVVVGALAFAIVANSGGGEAQAQPALGEASTTSTTSTSTTASTTTTEPSVTPATTPPVTANPTTTTTLPSAEDLNDLAAYRELEAMADRDASRVGQLLDRWVPQVSAKQPGMDVANDDRGAYSVAAVLSDHLGYRERYNVEGGGALLVRSGDFASFKTPGFWVTVVDMPFDTPEQANGWCDAQGIGVDDCFAKRISRVHAWEGSTKGRK